MIVSPAAPKVSGDEDLPTWIAGARIACTVSRSVPVTGGPVGGRAVTSAVFAMCPASTSACVVTCSAVQVVDWPAASVVSGQVTAPSRLSVSAMACSVTFPVLVTA